MIYTDIPKILRGYYKVVDGKLTEGQFEYLWEQESKEWYPKKIYLGEISSLEIYTTPVCWENEINPPSESYLKVIKEGLKETTGWDEREVGEYLKKAQGGCFEFYFG